MRKHFVTVPLLLFAVGILAHAGTTVTPTTTLAKETGNNTSTASTFVSQTNGNIGAGNVSKVPLRSLLYNGSHTKLYAHLMPWFGNSSHINVGYNSATFAQANAQVSDMISRGFDGAILDWYGPKNSQVNQASLYFMQAAQAAGGQFTFAIMEDVGAINACANTAGCDLNQQVVSDLNYVNSTYSSSSSYMRINGRPVIFFFGLEKYTLDWNVIRAGVQGNPLFIFRNAGAFTKTQSDGGFGWVSVNKTNPGDIGISYLDYFYATALKYPSEVVYGTAYKGFNDTLASWTANRIMNQDCGQTWLSTFAELSRYYSTSNELPFLQVATWNDYEEGTEIESGIDNCVAVGGSMSDKVLNWNISGQENTIDHYTVFISTDGVNLMPLADVPANGRSLDLSAFGFASASYTLYVKAVGKPSMTNKMSGPISWTLAQTNAGPQAQLSLTTTSGIAPVAVTASTAGSMDPDGSISSSTINFGDGTVIKAAVASHTYSAPGNYTVTATVTDNMGASSVATQSVNVLANQAPVAKVTVTPATGTAPVSVTVDASGSYDPDGSVASGTVSFGDGTIVSGLKATHTYSAAGSFLVIVTVTDDRGASSTATSTVTVSGHIAPKVNLAVTPTSGIAPVTVTAVAQASSPYGTPAVVINWGDGTTPISASSGTHTYSQTGSYTVTATATDSFGYKSTATAVVSVAKSSGKLRRRPAMTTQIHRFAY